MAAKVRPALVLSLPFGENDRTLIGVVPHTTSLRGSQFEVISGTRFLKHPGAFLVQGFATVPPRHFIRFLGTVSEEDLKADEEAMRWWLGL
jgi:mRNA interferase MazF